MYNHFSDNIPVMMLKSWPAESVLFDGDIMAGPVPSLFSENPESSPAGIMAEPRKAHWDLMKICRLLIMPEIMSLEDALAFIKKPR